jgi:hypothetical protein
VISPPQLEHICKVTTDGQVWSVRSGRFFKLQSSRLGYKSVCTTVDGVKRTLLVHRLVLSAYRPVEGWQELEVNHIDHDPSNNHIDNLEWVTHDGNVKHSYKAGRHIATNPEIANLPQGEQHWNAKLSDEEALAIRQQRAAGSTLKDLATAYSVSIATISMICNGRTFKHLGGPRTVPWGP